MKYSCSIVPSREATTRFRATDLPPFLRNSLEKSFVRASRELRVASMPPESSSEETEFDYTLNFRLY